MTTFPELLRIYKKGLKQLFFLKGDEGDSEKLSIVKIIILLAFILAFVFTFLQFSEANILNSTIEEWRDKGNVKYIEMFPLSIYGALAHLMNFIVVTGVIYFLVTREGPSKEVIQQIKHYYQQIKEFSTRSRFHFLVTVAILLISSLFSLQLSLQLILFPMQAITGVSYHAGKGTFIIWG